MLIVCIIAALFCALQSVRSVNLLLASLWLGGVSVAVAAALYLLGAWEMAVIELSVSAGLVMVLLVFAITVLGEPSPQLSRIHLGSLLLVCSITFGLILLFLPELPTPATDRSAQLAVTLWHDRSLDILLQIVLLFAGALTMLRLLKQPADEGSENIPIAVSIAQPGDEAADEASLLISSQEVNQEKELV